MTEDEAKAKWCPLSSSAPRDGVAPGINRYASGSLPGGTNCIASDCMAWRKDIGQFDRRTNELALPGAPEVSLEPRYTGHGFCGLSGAPQ